MGYHRAGFDVVGVDVAPQPDYPFEFNQADAMTFPLVGFDAVHASPPCQAYTTGAKAAHSSTLHPDLYGPMRLRLLAAGLPWVIENVPGAPSRSGIVLCGRMFGLEVDRHRTFETSWLIMQPAHTHQRGDRRPVIVAGHGGAKWADYAHSRHAPKVEWPRLMGMPWATPAACAEAIPPAYTEWIERQLLAQLIHLQTTDD